MQLHSGYAASLPDYSCAAAREFHPLPMPKARTSGARTLIGKEHGTRQFATLPDEQNCSRLRIVAKFEADAMTLGAL
jgi:hypothetical protein